MTDLEKIIDSFKREQLKKLILKTNKLTQILNKSYSKVDKYTIQPKQLIKHNNKLDVLIKNYEFLEDELEETIYNISNSIDDDEEDIDYTEELQKINENIEHTRQVIMPFIPYMLIYSMYLQNTS